MKKSEIFRNILNAIAEETEIEHTQILSGNRTNEIVDARHMLVKFLSENGFYPTEIASFTGLSHRTVNHILTTFDNRVAYGFYLRNSYAKIKQDLSNSRLKTQ